MTWQPSTRPSRTSRAVLSRADDMLGSPRHPRIGIRPANLNRWQRLERANYSFTLPESVATRLQAELPAVARAAARMGLRLFLHFRRPLHALHHAPEDGLVAAARARCLEQKGHELARVACLTIAAMDLVKERALGIDEGDVQALQAADHHRLAVENPGHIGALDSIVDLLSEVVAAAPYQTKAHEPGVVAGK